jgi:hypothetical protein
MQLEVIKSQPGCCDSFPNQNVYPHYSFDSRIEQTVNANIERRSHVLVSQMNNVSSVNGLNGKLHIHIVALSGLNCKARA